MFDRRTLLFSLFGMVLFAVSIGKSRADARDLYTLINVRVDERAADELEAKTQGINKAQQDALQNLIEKITLRDHYDLLPSVNKISVREAIRDYAVTDEKFGGGRYVATLTVRFKRKSVREMLRQRNIPLAETVSQPVVVLPVFRTAGSILLWDDPNPWYAAWANNLPTSGLLPLRLPLGDYQDIAVINAEQALNGNEEHLAAIAEKYKAIGTLVSVAELIVDPKTGTPSIEVSMTRFGKADSGRTFVRSFVASPGGNVEKLVREAVGALIIRAEEDWKRDNLQHPTGQQIMKVLVPLNSLENWLHVRDRLGRVSPVTDVNLLKISVKEVLLEVKFLGGPNQLRLSMAQSDLDLKMGTDNNGYVLRLSIP